MPVLTYGTTAPVYPPPVEETPPPAPPPPPPPPAATPANGKVYGSVAPAAPAEAAPSAPPPPPAPAAAGGGKVYGSVAPAGPVDPNAPPPAPPPVPVPPLDVAGGQLKEAVGDVGGKLLAGDLGGAKDELGDVREAAGTVMTAQGGDIFPYRRITTTKIAEEAVKPAPPSDAPWQDQLGHFLLAGEGDPWANAVRTDPAVQEAIANGYTDPESGTTFAPGPAAGWEQWVADKPRWQRAILDLTYDPSSLTIAAAPIRGAAEAGRIPSVVGKAARAADDIVSLGVGPAIEGGLGLAGKGLKAAGLLQPTAAQKVATAGAEAAESATVLAGARREGGQLSDVVATDVAPNVVRLEHPTGLIPPVVYKTDGRQIVGIVDDVANPGNVRPVTAADHVKIGNLAARLDPDTQRQLMNTGLRSLNLPPTTVARPYLQSLQRALPPAATPTGPLRGTIPIPASGPDLMALRVELRRAAASGNAPVVRQMISAANASGLIPPTTTVRDTVAAIGAVEAARHGAPLIDPAVLTAVHGTLRRNLDGLGLPDVGLNLERVINDVASGRPLPEVEGQYFNGVITLGLDLANSADEAELALRLGDVMNHEIVHAGRHFGLYKAVEWRNLQAMSASTKFRGEATSFLDEVTARYEQAYTRGAIPNLPSADQMAEEAVSDMYRAYVAGELVTTPVQRSLLQKITDFFRGIAHSVRGVNAQQTLQRIQSGELGARPRGAMPAMAAPQPRVVRTVVQTPPNVPPRPTEFTYSDSDFPFVSPNPKVAMVAGQAIPWEQIPDDLPPSGWALHALDPNAAALRLEALERGLRDNPKHATVVTSVLDATDQYLIDTGNADLVGLTSRTGPLMTAEQIAAMANMGTRSRLWYEKSSVAMRSFLDLPLEAFDRFLNVLAATSGGTAPEMNMNRTMALLKSAFTGTESWVGNRDYQTVREAMQGGQLRTDKFGNFALTFKFLMGLDPNPPRAVIDLQMAHIFGLPDNAILTPRRDVYNYLADYVEGVRDVMNEGLRPGEMPWETWQVQAAMWTDYRIRTGVQGEAADDYASAMATAYDKIAAAGLLEENGKIGMTAFTDPRIEELFGDAASFWPQTKIMTLEAASRSTRMGNRALNNLETLKRIDPALLEPPLGRRARGGEAVTGAMVHADLMKEALDIDTRVFKATKDAAQSFYQAVFGKAIKVSQARGIQEFALGSYEGQVSPNLRLPLGTADFPSGVTSAMVKADPTLNATRTLLDPQQEREVLALLTLGMDQEAGAASKFTTVPEGEHNALSVFLPDIHKRLNIHQEQALTNFTKAVDWPTSIKPDYRGMVIDIHHLDDDVPLHSLEEMAQLARTYLEPFFMGPADVWPRLREDIFLNGPAEYQPHIARALDRVTRPAIEALDKELGRRNLDEATRFQIESDIADLQRSVYTVATNPAFGKGSVRQAQEVFDRVISHYPRGFRGTSQSPPSALAGIGRVAGGWRTLADATAVREANYATFVRKSDTALETARSRAAFIPTDPERAAWYNARDRHREALNRLLGNPGDAAVVPTGAGPSFSVARFKTYHGSSQLDLEVLSANPPRRQYPFASSSLGGFATPFSQIARNWAGAGEVQKPWSPYYRMQPDAVPSRVYTVKTTLRNGYDMTRQEMERFYTDDQDYIDAAQAMKKRLLAAGHDGIVVWDTLPEDIRRVAGVDNGWERLTGINPNTFDIPHVPTIEPARVRDLSHLPQGQDQRGQILEVVFFEDKPVYSLAKGQSGIPPGRPGAPVIPGVYGRGSVEEYLGSLVSKADREVLGITHTFGGVTETAWETAVREQDRLERGRALALKSRGAPLTVKEQATLSSLITELRRAPELGSLEAEDLANWSDEALDHLVGRRVARYVEQSGGLRNAAGAMVDPAYYKGLAGKALKAYDNFAGFRRTMSLYSVTRGPQYVLMQAIGNALTLAIVKPGALKYYTPIQWNELRKAGDELGTGREMVTDTWRRETGLSVTERLGGSRDQLKLGSNTYFSQKEGWLKGVGKVVAPQWVKTWADGWDRLLRAAVWRSVYEPGYATLRRDLSGTAGKTLQDFAARAGVPSPVSGQQFTDAITALGPRFTGEQLRQGLRATAPGDAVVRQAADRIANDYINATRTLDDVAMKQVDRIGFSFDDTKLDAALSRMFMFHYWMSRASVLYLKEAARNPYQLQAWSRAMAAGNRQADEGVPGWQKDMIEFMSTPAGVVGLMSPAYLLGTYLFMQDREDPSPFADLTQVGAVLEGSFVSNLMLNPLLQGAIYAFGIGGPDFKPPDLFGSGKWTADVNGWLEMANHNVTAFYATEKGNPKAVPNIDAKTLTNWVATQITSRGWENDFFGMAPISGYDPNASEQANLSYLIQDAVLADHPELTDGSEESAVMVASMVEEAMGNPDSSYYQDAYDAYIGVLVGGPGSGRNNAFLDVGAYVAKQVLPFGMNNQVASRRGKQIRGNLDQKTALDTEMGYIDDTTPQKQAFDLGLDTVNGSWSPAANTIRDIESGIKSGVLPIEAVSIDGQTWTSTDLAALPSADRKTLAKYWMTTPHPELGGKSGRALVDEGYDAEEAALLEHPDVADYRALDDYANAYPDGALAFVRDTAAVNANYRRFVEQIDTTISEADFLKAATGVKAWGAITGTPISRYDSTPLPTGKGQIAGLPPGQSLGEWKQADQDAIEAEYSNDKRAQLDDELATYSRISQRLDQIDTMNGLAPGTTSARYAQNLADGAKYIDDDIYQTLKADGFSTGDINPRDEEGYNQIKWYAQWAIGNGVPMGQQVDTYMAASNRDWLAKQVANINGGILSEPDPVEDAAQIEAGLGGATVDPVGPVLPVKSTPWWQGISTAAGAAMSGLGGVISGISGHNGAAPGSPPATKPALTSAVDPASHVPFSAPSFDVVPAQDGMGVQSTAAGSDRWWMEDMMDGHATVTTDYKGPAPASGNYKYQIGHGATNAEHAAYDISCDDPTGNCNGTPIKSPITGTIVCAGYGQGQSTMPGASCNYSRDSTWAVDPYTGAPSAHTITMEVYTDPNGNSVQLSFNHMGSANGLAPGQVVSPGTLLGTMGQTDGGPHVHLEGWGYSPAAGTYVILDPQLIVGGYYQTHSVDGAPETVPNTTPIPGTHVAQSAPAAPVATSPPAAAAPSGGGLLDQVGGAISGLLGGGQAAPTNGTVYGTTGGGAAAPAAAPATTAAPTDWTFTRAVGTFDHTVIDGMDTTTYKGQSNPRQTITNAKGETVPDVEGIVYHFTSSSDMNFMPEFTGQTARKASANYVVEKDGTIHQLVDPDVGAAWAHGDTNNPDTSNGFIAQKMANGETDFNQNTISIEIVNEGLITENLLTSSDPKDFAPYTPEQLEAVQNLTNWLVWKYDLPADSDHLFGHSSINTYDKSDPGPLFPLAAIIANAPNVVTN